MSRSEPQPALEGGPESRLINFGWDPEQGSLINWDEEESWLDVARDAYRTSDDWFDTSIRKDIEKAQALFFGRHPAGSKYHSDTYEKRSKLFRPKTRSAERRLEAATAVALHGTVDALDMQPADPRNPIQVLGAQIKKELLNYRLTSPEMHWFAISQAAAQDSYINGVVIGKVEWEYAEVEEEYEIPLVDPITRKAILTPDGEQSIELFPRTRVVKDHPMVKILPIENFRIDPAADWYDPIGTSPYTIEMIPMYVWDIARRMRQTDPKTGKPQYRPLPAGLISSAVEQDWDSIRRARESRRLDKYDNETALNLYQIVWVRHHIFKIEGEDWVYDTLDSQMPLMDEPLPIAEVYRHGLRPYVMGNSIIEAHRQYPTGFPLLSADLQEEANDSANLRIDNLRHNLSKRWLVRRGRNVDLRSLKRNVPGGITLVTDPTDVTDVAMGGAGGDAFEHEERINADFDDLNGTFNASSVQTNRQMNETVGGMSMLKGDSNDLTEYAIRTFVETWVSPIFRLVLAAEQVYETDERVMAVVGEALNTDGEDLWRALDAPVKCRVNIGFGATQPERQVAKLGTALTVLGEWFPESMQKADFGEISKVVFGAVGFGDAERFFPAMFDEEGMPSAAEIEQLRAELEELQQMVQTDQIKVEGSKAVAMIREQGAMGREKLKARVALIREQYKGGGQERLIAMKRDLEVIDRRIKAGELNVKQGELMLQREALSHQIMEDESRLGVEIESMRSMATEASGDAGVIERDNYGTTPHADEYQYGP